MEKNNMENAKIEFKWIVEKYIIPLIDVKGVCRVEENEYHNKHLIETNTEIKKSKEIRIIRIFPAIGSKKRVPTFCVKAKLNSDVSISRKIEVILRELLKVAEYNYYTFSKQRDYGKGNTRSKAYKARTLNLAYELGICKWLTSMKDDNAIILHTVISHMITWSSKTYEGKRIPFGIVIDFDQNSKNDSDYLTFLENDSCAVFTDGVFSGILLDKKGSVLSFLTRNTKTSQAADKNRKIFVPYQFEDIAKHCNKHTVGVIALAGGEIIIVKDQSIQFARRGGKWIAFDFERIYYNLRPYFLNSGNDEKSIILKIKELYCTLLDVSFAHTGGCIAIITPDNDSDVSDKITKERIDLYSTNRNDKSLKGVSSESKEKIIILSYLLSDNDESGLRSFFNVDRVLRKEILGLDGATVVSLDGSFYCAGSIVEVPSGSSGGGRTAAAKKLANFGVGIKISEDGYIEAYGSNEKGSRIIRLFCFK